MFRLHSEYTGTGDQPQAILKLTDGIRKGVREQVLLGVTGSGKTFTIANVIASVQRPALVISHNKTLAAQLYQELRDYFPENAVSYFVSYYDYYQPEAYIPQTDTYIEKETQINEEIDKLRLAATANLLTRTDTIVVASVSSIYNIGSPKEYGHFILELRVGMRVERKSTFLRLVALQYERSDYGFHRGSYRVRGETIEIFPAYEDNSIRIVLEENVIRSIIRQNPLTGKPLEQLTSAVIYPAKHYMTDPSQRKDVFKEIHRDLEQRVKDLKSHGKDLEAHRINQRVTYDLEMISEMGYVNGIENYSRYFDGRNPGDPPFTLLDYYGYSGGAKGNAPWLLVIDESHMTIPQIRGMYNGDRSRKQTLIDYGFRLPAALDNRPLTFSEFIHRMPDTIYVSATPDEWELGRAQKSSEGKNSHTGIVEQLIRPTGIIDPVVTIRATAGQIHDILNEIAKRVKSNQRVLITTLTKQTAEDLSEYLKEQNVKIHYLHSDIETLERSDILADLRIGKYDAIVGVNLLREGLDLPEVSLVIVLDADKQGFLRSKTSLIQTMGRAARNTESEIILYADKVTDAMKGALAEVDRRRSIQTSYNKKHGIIPKTIIKPVRARLVDKKEDEKADEKTRLAQSEIDAMTPLDRETRIRRLQKAMREASYDLNFELAAEIRDLIRQLSED